MSDATSPTDSSAVHPSMVGGHAKYIQGAISSTLGYESGEATKRDAVNEMRRASLASQDVSAGPNDRPVQSNVLGTVERKVGELTGCDGLVKDGEQRMGGGPGAEEGSGTG